MFSNLLKHFEHVIVELPARDLVAGTLHSESEAVRFKVRKFGSGILRGRKSVQPLDKLLNAVPGDLLKINFEGFKGVETSLVCSDLEGSVVTLEQVKSRILEVETLMLMGRVPPSGFWVYINKGILKGKSGVIVGGVSEEGREHRVNVRFHDSDESYILECDIRNCRLLSGEKMRLEETSYKLIFQGEEK